MHPRGFGATIFAPRYPSIDVGVQFVLRLRSASRKYRGEDAIRTQEVSPSGVRGQGRLSVYFNKKKSQPNTATETVMSKAEGANLRAGGKRNALSGHC